MLRHAVYLLILSQALHTSASPFKTEEEITPSPSEPLESSENSIVVDKTSEPEVVVKSSNTGSAWPDGEYCIMPGPSFKCPAGFEMDSVSLAVPMNFGIREEYQDKGRDVPYIQLGRFGGFNLGLREYDQAYILRLNACCKAQ